MRQMTAPLLRPHRSALWTCLIASALLVAACSSDDKTSQDSSGAAPTTAFDSNAPQSTSAGDAESATTIAGTDPGASTTTSPVAASETTAPDIMRGPPIMSTVPDSTGDTTAATATTGVTETTVEVTTTSAAPESTTTTPPITEPATTVPAGDGCVSCAANFVFPYAFFDVPQLGTEPVRGTGCGADGTLGEVIPDGIWDARSIKISASTIGIDVQCVYYGNSGAQLLANCLAEEGPDGCEGTDPDFWFVNASSRIRTMPLAAEFRRRYATIDCVDPGPGNTRGVEGQDEFDSWVIIEQGEATFALTSCVYG